jgi:hypothetical protein
MFFLRRIVVLLILRGWSFGREHVVMMWKVKSLCLTKQTKLCFEQVREIRWWQHGEEKHGTNKYHEKAEGETGRARTKKKREPQKFSHPHDLPVTRCVSCQLSSSTLARSRACTIIQKSLFVMARWHLAPLVRTGAVVGKTWILSGCLWHATQNKTEVISHLWDHEQKNRHQATKRFL